MSTVRKVHLDTDIGGDIDDLCALALLLRWPEAIEITGITTVADIDGRRAGYVRRVLAIEGRSGIPVAAGADVSLGYYAYPLELPQEEHYWPEPVAASPNPVEEAVDLLKSSIDKGAVVVAIGPYTNLYLVEKRFPGILGRASLVLMGGYLYPPRPGFPRWGNEMDFNVQVDARSALTVFHTSRPTLVPLSITVETALRRAHLNDLTESGPLGRLLARQAEAFAMDERFEIEYGQVCPGLPSDIINFQHDPLACAVALGWQEGMVIEDLNVAVEIVGGLVTERRDAAGSPARFVTQINGEAFSQFWVNTISAR